MPAVIPVPVGRYQIQVSKESFQPQTRTGIELVVGQHATVGFTLQVGQVAQAVTVEASCCGSGRNSRAQRETFARGPVVFRVCGAIAEASRPEPLGRQSR